jgi:hypothetical protein
VREGNTQVSESRMKIESFFWKIIHISLNYYFIVNVLSNYLNY